MINRTKHVTDKRKYTYYEHIVINMNIIISNNNNNNLTKLQTKPFCKYTFREDVLYFIRLQVMGSLYIYKHLDISTCLCACL